MNLLNRLGLSISYRWEPFEFEGKHLSFQEHKITRLYNDKCTHWGAAIYKWEGQMRAGPYLGHTGILIGETEDLRQRIKQYISGTQKSGNAYWRDVFLEKGDIYLYILRLNQVQLESHEKKFIQQDLNSADLSSGNRRVVFEQLLLMREVEKNRNNLTSSDVWIVNRKI